MTKRQEIDFDHPLVVALAELIEARDAHSEDWQEIARVALGLLHDRRMKAQVEREMKAARQWVSERGLIFGYEYADKYGLSEFEFRAAIDAGLLVAHHPPSFESTFWFLAVPDTPLTDDERARLADLTLLTANQAAKRLGITRAQFDRLKKKHGLEAAEMRHSANSQWPFALWRQSDIDRLNNN